MIVRCVRGEYTARSSFIWSLTVTLHPVFIQKTKAKDKPGIPKIGHFKHRTKNTQLSIQVELKV